MKLEAIRMYHKERSAERGSAVILDRRLLSSLLLVTKNSLLFFRSLNVMNMETAETELRLTFVWF